MEGVWNQSKPKMLNFFWNRRILFGGKKDQDNRREIKRIWTYAVVLSILRCMKDCSSALILCWLPQKKKKKKYKKGEIIQCDSICLQKGLYFARKLLASHLEKGEYIYSGNLQVRQTSYRKWETSDEKKKFHSSVWN